MGLFRNRPQETPVTILADGTAIPTPAQPTVASELDRLATERAEIEAEIETDTYHRAIDTDAWEYRDGQRHRALKGVRDRIRELEAWGPVALHHDDVLHVYLSTVRPIEARHRSVRDHVSYNLINGHEVGSVRYDLEQWLTAIATLSAKLDGSTEVPKDLARDYMKREMSRWVFLRSAHECAAGNERNTAMPYPELAEKRTGTPELPSWLSIGAFRADK